MKMIFKGIEFFIPELKTIFKNNVQTMNDPFWIIKDGQLFLHTNSSEKDESIIAVWVDTKIEIELNPEINYNRFNDYSDFYDKAYMVLNIERGVVIKKYIMVHPKSKSSGGYYDHMVTPKHGQPHATLKKDIINILKENYKDFVSNKYLDHLKEISTSIVYKFNSVSPLPSFDYFQKGNTIVDLLIDKVEVIIGSDFIFLYSGYKDLNSDFKKLLVAYFKYKSKLNENSDNLFIDNGKPFYQPFKMDTDYIKWAINNLRWFILSPDFFAKELSNGQQLILEPMRDIFFDYRIEKNDIYWFEFLSEDDLNKNFSKMNLNFDFKLEKYIYKRTKQFLLFDYFLDDSTNLPKEYRNQLEFNTTKKVLTFSQENEKYKECQKDEYYDSSNWLRDAAGTDDPETMNDVYWNLD